MVVWYRYTLCSDEHNQATYNLTSHTSLFLGLVRTLKIYSFGQFRLCNTALWVIVTRLYIGSPELLPLVSESLCSLTTVYPLLPTPQSLVTAIYSSILGVQFFYIPHISWHSILSIISQESWEKENTFYDTIQRSSRFCEKTPFPTISEFKLRQIVFSPQMFNLPRLL